MSLAKYLAKLGEKGHEGKAALLSALEAGKGMAKGVGEAYGHGGSALMGAGAGAGGMVGLQSLLDGHEEPDGDEGVDEALALRHRQRKGGM